MFLKNVFMLANGKWRFEIQQKNKTFRKTFFSKSEAVAFKNTFFAARKFDLSYFVALDENQIKDIKDALAALPKGKTLLDSVKRAWEFDATLSLHDALDKFVLLKQAKNQAGKLSDKELRSVRGRICNFKSTFSSFSETTPQALLTYLTSKGRNTTIQHWKSTVSEFFSFCTNRDMIRANPMLKIHADELIKPDPPHTIGFLSLKQAQDFLALLEEKYPQNVRFYAIALFAGVRIAEIPRMQDNHFLYDEKKIIFPAQIGKIKKAWTLEDLPPNLWAWLEKYKLTPILPMPRFLRTKIGKELNLPYNFARHTFATYHLSLYFDPAKTAKITRNSEQMLKDHYWGALTDKATAKAYFEIMPR